MRIFTTQLIRILNRCDVAGRLTMIAGAFILGMALSASAADIAWVSSHPADDMPSEAAAMVGFTEAPDVGYTDLLAANGHTVTRYQSTDAPDVNLLNSFDVVIIGRGVNSAHYELDPETAAWNSVGAPTIDMSGFTLRNNRLGFTTGTTIVDTTGTINLAVTNTAHPIFAGVPLSGSTMVNDFAGLVTFNAVPQRGISVATNDVVAGGTVLATVATAADPTVGEMIIGQFAPGTTMANSPPDVLGGHRLVFLSGSREPDDVSLETGGIYDLETDGTEMFLNAVDYMVGLETFLPGDATGEGVVDINDYLRIRNNFQRTNATRSQGDLNFDGNVNFTDFRLWKDNRNAGSGSIVGENGLVPEPGSFTLVLISWIAGSGLVARRR